MTYSFQTSAGVFQLVHRRWMWHVMFAGESLGSYDTPRQAADAVASGLTFLPSSGVDPETLSISHDLRDWVASIS